MATNGTNPKPAPHETENPPREPLVTAATVIALGAAILALLVAFGVDLTDPQRAAILGVLAVIAPLIVIVARKAVYSPRTVKRLIEEHRHPDRPADPPATPTPPVTA